MNKDWYVYIVRCSDNSLYTGITVDIDRRILEHNTSNKGAKYTRSRRPVKLVHTETYDNRSTPSKRESAIKKLNRSEKFQTIWLCPNRYNRKNGPLHHPKLKNSRF